MESDDETHTIFTAFEDLGAVIEALEASLGPAKSTAIVWKPKTVNPVSADEASTLFKLIDALDDDDDVQTVYTNADFTDDQLASWGA